MRRITAEDTTDLPGPNDAHPAPSTTIAGMTSTPLAMLVARAREGDSDAWETIVARYERLVWSVIRGLGLRHSDAEDVAQTTWFRLVDQLDRLREPEAIGSWLAMTARREAIHVLRRSSRQIPVADFDEHFGPNTVEPGERLFRTDEQRTVRRALTAIPDRCRQLLRLWALDPRPSYEEISVAMGGMPTGSIGPTRGRCLEQLRNELAALGISER